MIIKTWHARDKRNITLTQLSEMTGIGKSTLNNIENGITSPTLDQLERIAKALNTKISELYESDYK